jgi:UDP-GlcNAc3NAcA epimerase
MKVLSVIGARPQFVKAAMFCIAVRKHNQDAGREKRVRHVLVHTGQHYERNLSDIFFKQLPLPKPQHWLGVGSGTHGAQTAAMLERIESVLLKEQPDVVVVYGDTNSTIAGGLAASKLHIPVAHVEAGLRSFNRQMPEEINRVATDHVSDLLFCPTRIAIQNLSKEGITKGAHLSGDIMLDAVQRFRPVAVHRQRLLSKLGVRPKNYVLVTIHRAENTDTAEHFEPNLRLLMRLDLPVVFPLHPRVRDRLLESQKYIALRHELQRGRQLHITPPVSYLDMLMLERNARLILTDSGGVQKEAYFLSVPCITLRDETEWLETLRGGWNRLRPRDQSQLLSLVHRLWSCNGVRPKSTPNVASFGNGRAAEFILSTLIEKLC